MSEQGTIARPRATATSSHLHALVEMTEAALRHRAALLDRAHRLAETLVIDDEDPIAQPWCMFQMLGATTEPWWTQYLAELLRLPERPLDLRTMTWRAIRRAVGRRGGSGDPTTRSALSALERPPVPNAVAAEYQAVVQVNGSSFQIRPDIVIDEPERIVILELKLWGSWNPGPDGEDQPSLYRRFGEDVRGDRELVLLTLGIHRRPEEGWLDFTWSELAHELRRELRELRGAVARLPAAAFPLLALVVGIERYPLDLRPISTTAPLTWRAYENARRFVDHFEHRNTGP